MTKIFLDTEFTSLSQSAELISMALVSECGKSFYGVFNDFNPLNCSAFTQQNVLPYLNEKNQHLLSDFRIIAHSNEIKSSLKEWLSQFDNIQIWADTPHYDWVLFCELFGGATQIPQNIHFICLDLSTLLFSKGLAIDKPHKDLLGKEELPKDYLKHNALSDAQVGMKILLKLLYGKEQVL